MSFRADGTGVKGGGRAGGTQILELPEEKTSPSTGFLFLCAPPLFGPFAGTEFEYVLVEFAGISIPTQIL